MIGAVLMKNQGASYQTASLNMSERAAPMTRDLAGASPAARAGAVCAGGADGRHQHAARHLSGLDRRRRQGLFRLQFGKAMGKDEVASLIGKLRSEKIVSLAEAAP